MTHGSIRIDEPIPNPTSNPTESGSMESQNGFKFLCTPCTGLNLFTCLFVSTCLHVCVQAHRALTI